MWATKNVLVPIDIYSIFVLLLLFLGTMYIGWDQHLQPTNYNLLSCSIEEEKMYTGLNNMTEYSFFGWTIP